MNSKSKREVLNAKLIEAKNYMEKKRAEMSVVVGVIKENLV